MNLKMKIMRWAWEKLSVALLRDGFGYLYMKHFLSTEVDKICKNPVAAAKAGFEIFPRC